MSYDKALGVDAFIQIRRDRGAVKSAAVFFYAFLQMIIIF